ncbi:MAG: YgcG family protein [Candidatus Accumulibacter sp.]|nr:YgcG family protein [Accumulibacter sp.]
MPSLSARALFWLFGLLWLIGAHGLFAAELQPIPRLSARVTDTTSTLSAEQQRALEAKLAALERQKGSQIAVLIVPTVAPESIEQYALRVAESWKLGRRGIDDGALLLIAKQDRKLRIEVGYGLEGVVNDATAKRVISETISPRFRDGDFYAGIDAGIDSLARIVGGEPLPPPAVDLQQNVSAVDDNLALLLFAGFLLVFVFGRILRAIFGRFMAAGIVGIAAGAAAAVLLSSLVVAAIAGVVAFLASLMFGTLSSAGWSTGGFSWGNGRGGGFGGGGGSGGGFSGGGGGFGGGGASGGW